MRVTSKRYSEIPNCSDDESYDAADDFSRSLDACYAAIRVRVAAGGKAWEPK